jgi:hypothetical protein
MARRLLLTVIAVVILSVVGSFVATAAAPLDAPAPPSTIAADNEFVPDRDLDECVSSLPQPDCGSEGRGGWRQAAVLGVLVAAVAFITWRIVRSARSSRPERSTTHDA